MFDWTWFNENRKMIVLIFHEQSKIFDFERTQIFSLQFCVVSFCLSLSKLKYVYGWKRSIDYRLNENRTDNHILCIKRISVVRFVEDFNIISYGIRWGSILDTYSTKEIETLNQNRRLEVFLSQNENNRCVDNSIVL